MTPERLDQIELQLLREWNVGPLDGRQPLVKLGLELVAGIKRTKEVQASASALSSVRLAWHNESWTYLKQAISLLEQPTARIGGAQWMTEARAWLKKVKGE
jgi:hypothetical protein